MSAFGGKVKKPPDVLVGQKLSHGVSESCSLGRHLSVPCQTHSIVCFCLNPSSSLSSGKNLANNGHSGYKCGSLAELPEASAAGNFFFWRVLALRRASLREFSAVFLSFYTFQK